MNANTLRPPTADDIQAAADALGPYRVRTPLLRLNGYEGPGEVYLKLENLQTIGAYKVRSIGNLLLNTDPADLRHGAYTASSGNAGLALAWMAEKLGIPARVYATESSPAAKLDAIRHCGAEVCLLDAEEWWHIIEDSGYAKDPGLYADAVRDPLALAGNATIGVEIAGQLPDVDTVILPFGGGGVACGTAAGLNMVKPGVRVMVAESDAATPASAAFAAGHPTEVPVTPSFISGAGAPCVLKEMWPLINELVIETRVVPVAAVAGAIRHLCRHNRVVAEGAGALPVAAALADGGYEGKTVCVVTGGNIDADVLAAILNEEL
ncbi:threonine ammonia-lyase [Elongatibacter sediminis]|uniref:Pyridoxal-phosphate dependent enzyme n=1 Tax=Elongatibacter sediminis TaxID=3119006 RepID=A0AAW9RIZ7_9GAMM